LNFNRLIPGTIRSVLFNETPVIRSDGTYVRDYIYVADAVDAYLRVAEAMEHPEVVGEAFNFGYGSRLTALEVVQLILRLMGCEGLTPRIRDEATNEIKTQYLSSEKAERLLGWKPRYTLEGGLQAAIQWYREFFRCEAIHA
jgi:CDP-glucose 4,6-dehydratase